VGYLGRERHTASAMVRTDSPISCRPTSFLCRCQVTKHCKDGLLAWSRGEEMFMYITNSAIIVFASLVLVFPSQPTWLTIMTSLGTIALALVAMTYEFVNGARTVEVSANDWQVGQAGDFYFDVQRRFSRPTRCVTYIAGENGAHKEAVFDVSRIDGGFRIRSNSAIKTVLEIS
jgi:hypothetical protein